MKTLKILTIVAVTGLTGALAQGMQHKGDCDNTERMGKNYSHSMHKGDKRKKNHKANPNRRINKLLRNLDLTETQKNQLKGIRKSMWQARKAQRKALRGSMGLKKFVSVDGFDKSGFILASQERAKEMSKVRADMMEKIIAVLTPEQRIALVEKLNRQGKGKRHQRQ